MNLINYYWYFKSVLSPKFCDDLIEHGKKLQEQTALIGNYSEKTKEGKKLTKKEIKDLKKKRNSNIAWINDKWVYNQIQPYVFEANKNSGWNFDWDWSESCQFTKYSKGQFYDWHCDSWNGPYNAPDNPTIHNKIRKLSVTCTLSDPKDYKGGELEFDFRNEDPGKNSIRKCTEILPRGSIVVFPSFVWHRVKPVTKGTRYSLVIWNLGYPFR